MKKEQQINFKKIEIMQVEIYFIAKGIRVKKSKINSKKSIEENAERFREDMLAKFDLFFKKEPHLIQIKYI